MQTWKNADIKGVKNLNLQLMKYSGVAESGRDSSQQQIYLFSYR